MLHVEDFGGAMAGQRLLDCFDTKVGFERDRHSPGQHPSGEPIQHCSQVDTGRLPPAQDASVSSARGDGVDAQHKIAKFWIGLGGISQNHLIRA